MAIKKVTKTAQPTIMLKHILKRCSSLGKKQGSNNNNDVPKGHFAVYVGENRTRYIVPIMLLYKPEFQCLLRKSEQEFGFCYDVGLTLPCDDRFFQSLTSFLLS
ncbi:hypothetical protein RND81_02G058300 [Saponaria officinalis]|uniref:Uncharacterized protein n=1 Tax=Saponaria officinalis TaxID=3572 RepID=A0AAW1MU75_SAPOF